MGSNRIIGAIIALSLSFTANAQSRVSGLIKEAANGSSISGASVYLPDLKKGIIADSTGAFHLSGFRSGNYLFEVTAAGYKTIVRKVNVLSDTTLFFDMSPTAQELHEIVVTGVSRSSELKQSPVMIKTMDRKAFLQNSFTNVIDALTYVPGVNQITTGAAVSKPVIRGLGYNRVITLNNGIRQEGQQWGDEHGIEIDENEVDRVEIVKGPGSLVYGSDGISGVINFLPPKSPAEGEIKTQAISGYQTNNRLFSYSVFNAGNKNGYQWSGRFSNKLAGNYRNALDGPVYNSGFRELNGSLFLGINKSWGHSHFAYSSYNNTTNLPEGERDSLGRFTYVNAIGDVVTASGNDYAGYKTGFPHQKISHSKYSLNNYLQLKNGTLHVDMGYQINNRREFGDPTQPENANLDFLLHTLNYNLKYNVNMVNGWETTAGVNGMNQSNTNRGSEFLIPAYRLWDAGLFLFSQKTKEKITVAGGLRFDYRSVHSESLYIDSTGSPVSSTEPDASMKFKEIKTNFTGFSGSLGLSWRANKEITIKFNVAKGYRAPNISELASNGRHEGTFRYESGNAQLKPETSYQADLGFFFNSDHITLEISPFVNFINNYIYTEKLKTANGSDSIADPADPAPVFLFTSGNARLTGAEIYFDFHPHPLDWLHIENSFSFVQAVQPNQPDSLKYLPFIPPARYRAEIKGEWARTGKVLNNFYFKLGLDRYFKQDDYFRAYGTETATPAYTLFSAGVGAEFESKKGKKVIGLYISGENLTDEAYQSHLSRLKYAPVNPLTGNMGIYNMGRNISIKMTLRL
jgi:iron complex outermembrane receptor protein